MRHGTKNIRRNKENVRILVNSIPKSGTNLLTRAMDLLGFRDQTSVPPRTRIYHRVFQQLGFGTPWSLNFANVQYNIRARTNFPHAPSIPIGLQTPASVPRPLLKKWLNNLSSGQYMSGHVMYSDEFHHLLQSLNYKHLVIVRDPEDVLTSRLKYELNWDRIRYDSTWARYVFRSIRRVINQSPFFHISIERELRARNPREQMKFILEGGYTREGKRVLGLNEQFQRMLPWKRMNNTLMVQFEGLIGPGGGSSKEQQIQTIQSICQFLDLPVADDTIQEVAEQVYDPESTTFRKGRTGGSTGTDGADEMPVRESELQGKLEHIRRMMVDHDLRVR